MPEKGTYSSPNSTISTLSSHFTFSPVNQLKFFHPGQK